MHTQVTITIHKHQIESRISNWIIYLLNTDTPHTHPSDSCYTLTLYRKLCLQGVASVRELRWTLQNRSIGIELIY